MKVIKIFLMIVFVVTLGAGLFYVASARGLIKTSTLPQSASLPTLPKTLSSITFPTQLSFITDGIKEATTKPETEVENASGLNNQVTILSSRLGTVGEEVGEVLGTTVAVEDGQKVKTPLHERAFERGRYLYCQEVIRDYQQRYETPE